MATAEPQTVKNTGGTDYEVLVDSVVDGTLGTGEVQYVKIADGTINSTNKALVDSAGRFITRDGGPNNAGAQTIVAAVVTANTTLIAADTTRVGLMIYNDSTAVITMLVGAGTQSATVFSLKIPANTLYTAPDHFAPLRHSGQWASATGSARITAVV